MEQLEKAVIYLRDRLLVCLLFRLGCRASETLGIGVEDIDFTHSTVAIKDLKSHIQLSCPYCGAGFGRSHAHCPKCGKRMEMAVTEEREHRRMRTLPVDKETLEMLKNYTRRGGPVTQEGKRLIFGINRHRGWQVIKECADRAGMGKLVNPETGKLHNVSPHRLTAIPFIGNLN